MMSEHGLLLINFGSPDTPRVGDVRRYLARFLSDRRVITLPAFLRYGLLYGIILPFRTPKVARAYQSIWTPEGSPLQAHSQALEKALQKKLPHYTVRLGMRYGSPSIQEALHALRHCKHLTVLPLYPQYASASTGSCIAVVLQTLASQTDIPALHVIRSFYENATFIRVQAARIRPYLTPGSFLLFSYHGLPQSHLPHTTCATAPCNDPNCYRGQCYQTSQLLAEALKCPPDTFDTAFQSQLGYAPWTRPYTTERLTSLAANGIRDLVIACPSFTADCLETLEEIGEVAKKQWLSLGGKTFTLVPSLNAWPEWVDVIPTLLTDD